MNIAEVLRQQTLAARDKLAGLGEKIAHAEALRNAAEERVKRAGTEITRQRTLERERKRSVGIAADKVTEAEHVLDEIERKRQDALEALTRAQDEQATLAKSLREAQHATEDALEEIRKEQRVKQDSETELATVRADRKKDEVALRRAFLKGLDRHLERQAATIQALFSTHEQRSSAMREFEAFKKARHTDPQIGKLCDERDEIQKLLSSAMVPGVKEMLQSSLTRLEEIIAKRFPLALQMSDVAPKDNPIEELLFYCDPEENAVFLLPVLSTEWAEVEEGILTVRTSNSMRFVWNMIRELGLRTEDGDFRTTNSRVEFASKFDLETIATQDFSVKYEETKVMRCVCAAVPTELREALSHEDQDN